MSNPVFNRMEGQWANQSTAATAQATHPPVYDQKAFEEAIDPVKKCDMIKGVVKVAE